MRRLAHAADGSSCLVLAAGKSLSSGHNSDRTTALESDVTSTSYFSSFTIHTGDTIHSPSSSVLSAGLILRSSPLGLPPRCPPSSPCSSPHRLCLACSSVLRVHVPRRPPHLHLLFLNPYVNYQ